MEPFVGREAELVGLRAELTLVSTHSREVAHKQAWLTSIESPPRLAFGGKAGKPCVTRSPSFATV
jgi:hypothetical protein